MEQSNNFDQNTSDMQSVELNQKAVQYLLEVTKWAKFLAILGFVFIGLLILLGLFMGTVFSAFMPMNSPFVGGGQRVIMLLLYFAIAVLYFFPVLYLFRFSVQTQNALRSNDHGSIESGMENLKSHYKFIGILTIIVISLYILGFLLMGLFAGAMMH